MENLEHMNRVFESFNKEMDARKPGLNLLSTGRNALGGSWVRYQTADMNRKTRRHLCRRCFDSTSVSAGECELCNPSTLDERSDRTKTGYRAAFSVSGGEGRAPDPTTKGVAGGQGGPTATRATSGPKPTVGSRFYISYIHLLWGD